MTYSQALVVTVHLRKTQALVTNGHAPILGSIPSPPKMDYKSKNPPDRFIHLKCRNLNRFTKGIFTVSNKRSKHSKRVPFAENIARTFDPIRGGKYNRDNMSGGVKSDPDLKHGRGKNCHVATIKKERAAGYFIISEILRLLSRL